MFLLQKFTYAYDNSAKERTGTVSNLEKNFFHAFICVGVPLIVPQNLPSITFPLKVPLPEQVIEMLSGLSSSCFIEILIWLHRLFKYSMSMNAVANPLADIILRLMVDFLFFVTDNHPKRRDASGGDN